MGFDRDDIVCSVEDMEERRWPRITHSIFPRRDKTKQGVFFEIAAEAAQSLERAFLFYFILRS